MNPEQFKLLEDMVRVALSGQLQSITLVATIVAGLIALASGYFGSYLWTKGANLATKEDFDSLLAQLKAQTEATEEVKARISQTTWVGQKWWEVKRELYTDLMCALYKLFHVLGSRHELCMAKETPNELAVQQRISKEEDDLVEEQTSLLDEVIRVRGIGEVVFSAPTVSILSDFYTAWNTLDTEAPVVFQIDEALRAVKTAHDSLVAAAKLDLGLLAEEQQR